MTETAFANCPECGREMNGQECAVTTYTIRGVEHARLTYPPTDLDWMPAEEFGEHCRDCGTPKGGLHHPRCCMEDCPVGDGQWLNCAHRAARI